MSSAVGEIREESQKTFNWHIYKFFSLTAEPEVPYESPEFDFNGVKWFLKLLPNRKVNDSNESSRWLSLYLCKSHSESLQHSQVFSISLIMDDVLETEDYHVFIVKDVGGLGPHNIIDWSEFISNKEKLLTDNILQISVSMRLPESTAVEASCQTTQLESSFTSKRAVPLETLSCNLKDHFLSKKNSDVTIKVKEQEFQAHRSILEARSDAFTAMFKQKIPDNKSYLVALTNVEPDVFHDVLFYIYSGHVEKLCPDNVSEYYKIGVKLDLIELKRICVELMKNSISVSNVCEYYKIAEKHGLKKLKDKCVNVMESNMSALNVCDILILADMYKEITLKELAKDFIVENSTDVIESDSWRNFAQDNPVLSIQILETTIKNMALKRCKP